MTTKPKILVFVDWFLPGKNAGGPIRSVANIVKTLSDHFDFHIVTSVYDFGATKPYKGVKVDQWTTYEGIRVWYASAPMDRQTVTAFFNDGYDAVYLNSLFSKEFTRLPLKVAQNIGFKGKIILAPRGMLGAGALAIKATKKKVFLKLASIMNWYGNVLWHASTEQEGKEIRKWFGGEANIVVAENLAMLPPFNESVKPVKRPGEVHFIFVSRISVKKNILFWIELLSRVTATSVSFTVIGPVEDKEYWQTCREKFAELGMSFELNYLGSLEHQEVLNVLNRSHFFVLPTHHENYGHVVIEALAMGCPLLLSENTPWRNLEERNIGRDISLSNTEKWVEQTQQLIDMDAHEYKKQVQACLGFAHEKLNDRAIVEKNVELFTP